MGTGMAISSSSSSSASKLETMKWPEWMASLYLLTAMMWDTCVVAALQTAEVCCALCYSLTV